MFSFGIICLSLRSDIPCFNDILDKMTDRVTGNCHDLQTSAGEYFIVQSRAAGEGSFSAF